MSRYSVTQGDSLHVLRNMQDNSVDAVVTDPPYGLSFMGKRWDYDVPSVEVWAECLRVLKPGGHLLAFAGTRTQHRMAVRIEDAGFEIRDMIAWVYGSGFPKSLDVSKAIDKAAGSEREVVGPGRWNHVKGSNHEQQHCLIRPGGKHSETAPATEAASQWQGWGTALKPALETVTFASKPYSDEQERDIIQSNLIRLESRLWLLSSASAVEKSSASSQSEYGAACAIAQWSADEITSTRGALCAQMDTSLFELATNTSLSIASSWRRTLAESWSDGSMCITETRSSTTIDWKTLKFSLSQITPESIIMACSLPGGFSANASTAESHFNASLLLLQSIRTLSATEPVISQERHEHRGAGVMPNLDPCIMARKPLSGTVADNVLAHGTGALNIDGCRVEAEAGDEPFQWSSPRGGIWKTDPQAQAQAQAQALGRWPANLIHDGSEEVVALFPAVKAGVAVRRNSGGNTFGGDNPKPPMANMGYGDAGSAARFFYCAKANRKDRNEGCEGFEQKGAENAVSANRGSRSGPRENHHPTVKPTDLMRYLCRLVTPPGGVVLDPFTGSGSTGKAAMLEGFRFIGIEREEAYVEIAKARIAGACDDMQTHKFDCQKSSRMTARDPVSQADLFWGSE